MPASSTTSYSLTRLDVARRALAEARTLDDVKTIRDQAEAMRVYARQAQLGLESQNYAAEIKLRAERRAGELLSEMERHRQSDGRPPSTEVSPAVTHPERPRLDDLGVTRMQSSRWQVVAAIPEPIFEQHVQDVNAARQELTSAGLLRLARDPTLAGLFSSETPDWYTPPPIIHAVLRVFGTIDLDPCSNSRTAPRVPARQYYTAEDDGLSCQGLGQKHAGLTWRDEVLQALADIAGTGMQPT